MKWIINQTRPLLERSPIFRLIAVFAVGIVLSASVFAADGDLDPTFAFDGDVTTNVGVHDTGRIVIAQPDGKILIVGRATGFNVVLIRYLSDGTLDPTFATGGIFSGNQVTAYTATLRTDGKIIVMGQAVGFTSNIPAMRLNSNGTVDAAWGIAGVATQTITGGTPSQSFLPIGIRSNPDGSLSWCGYAAQTANGTRSAVLGRFTAAGIPDATFGSGGFKLVNTEAGDVESVTDADFTADGKFVVYGTKNTPQAIFNVLLIQRFNQDGSPDTSFNGVGWRSIDYFAGVNNNAATNFVFTLGGKILLGSNNGGPGLTRLNPDGSIDTTFDGDGFFPGRGANVAEVNSGKFFGFGTVGQTTGVVKYNYDGSVDTSFSGDGVAVPNGTVFDMAQQPDGKIVATGPGDFGATNTDFYTVRFLNTFAPTAADVTVSGRVSTSDGRGLTNAMVMLSDTHGNSYSAITGRLGTFVFENIPSGETYIAEVRSRRFSFEAKVIQLSDKYYGSRIYSRRSGPDRR